MDNKTQNKMGTMPIPKLLASMALPIMVSMIISALYNVVDSVYVSRIGETALAALSLSFPIQMLVVSFATGSGVGINALLSRKLGEGDSETASQVAKNGLFVGLICSVAFTIFGIFLSRMYFEMFTEDPILIEMGVQYTSICISMAFLQIMTMLAERIIQATGMTVYSMIAQMAGSFTNIILDPIFIFGYFGIPAMGVRGAAIATVIGFFVAFCIIFYFNKTKNHQISMSFKGFRPNLGIIKDIYRVGLPSILMQSIGSVMTIGMNGILISFSQVAVSVFGIYFKLQSFIFMPVFGLTNALVPIIAFNYGARQKKRIMDSMFTAMKIAVAIMVVGVLIFQTMTGTILTVLFDASDEMLAVGVPAIRIISLCFMPAAVAIVISNIFQALGNGMYSLIMSMIRQLVFLLPSAWVLGKVWGLNAVWFAFPFSELFAFVFSVFMFTRIYKDKLAPMDNNIK